ncbi:hypothetical protein IV38_GL001187 [Lactobacillus selangorensis]|uniref:Uncharacterized protein n=1 Tax=Lactobacillus selangorensis TaxID=81857 RepID=A0A0R2FWQ2_9LACO|nr:hypothetical protein [Lactobacillus selangorensis]KRN28974.1 hypothetical protein IV38_GL001187 [Lactobacillus selangorensis]KRN32616.1 hypothetical protein IV40_GL000666 [Lactobacillus selangorensis]
MSQDIISYTQLQADYNETIPAPLRLPDSVQEGIHVYNHFEPIQLSLVVTNGKVEKIILQSTLVDTNSYYQILANLSRVLKLDYEPIEKSAEQAATLEKDNSVTVNDLEIINDVPAVNHIITTIQKA